MQIVHISSPSARWWTVRTAGFRSPGVPRKPAGGLMRLDPILRLGGTRCALAPVEGPLVALGTVGKDAKALLAPVGGGADLMPVALFLTEHRGRVGYLRSANVLLGTALAPVEGPLVTLGTVGKDAEARLAPVGGDADLMPVALFLTEHRGRVGHAGLGCRCGLGAASSNGQHSNQQ